MSRKPVVMADSDTTRAIYIPQIIGRTITSAWFGKDNHGYDLLTLTFDDGASMQVHEQGQAGYFEVETFERPR